MIVDAVLCFELSRKDELERVDDVCEDIYFLIGNDFLHGLDFVHTDYPDVTKAEFLHLYPRSLPFKSLVDHVFFHFCLVCLNTNIQICNYSALPSADSVSHESLEKLYSAPTQCCSDELRLVQQSFKEAEQNIAFVVRLVAGEVELAFEDNEDGLH